MLHAYPTKNGTGISIFGDYGDLTNLYETIHEIANSLSESNPRLESQSKLLMNFAYEIRKAYSGQRLTDKVRFADENELPYYGFQIVWPDVLIFISVLRHNAGYIQTSKLHQSYLYLLEYIVEKALFAYDAEGANSIQHFIGQRINITDPNAFIIYQALHIKFVTLKPGKKRFRELPSLIIDHFSSYRPAYKELFQSLEASAKEQNCQISDLELSEFPEIKW